MIFAKVTKCHHTFLNSSPYYKHANQQTIQKVENQSHRREDAILLLLFLSPLSIKYWCFITKNNVIWSYVINQKKKHGTTKARGEIEKRVDIFLQSISMHVPLPICWMSSMKKNCQLSIGMPTFNTFSGQ